MKNKINIAELLKDCPKGMELYSPIFGEVYLDKIRPHLAIVVTTNKEHDDFKEEFLYDGRYGMNGECMLFPSKSKTTWDGFVPPCKFKAGDVLVSERGNIVLLSHIDSKNVVHYHCIIRTYGNFIIVENTDVGVGVGRYYECVLANEQQRQRMYDRIKCSGYKYNQNTNKLEKLVELKFKVGDRIKQKGSSRFYIINSIESDRYRLNNNQFIRFMDEKIYELVPNKFDINTLKPLQPVLVRDTNEQVWTMDLFSHKIDTNKRLRISFACVGHYPNQCIPYEGNEHLLGTTNDCDEYYKNW